MSTCAVCARAECICTPAELALAARYRAPRAEKPDPLWLHMAGECAGYDRRRKSNCRHCETAREYQPEETT